MYHIILFFAVAVLLLIVGIVNKSFEAVLWAVGFMMMGLIAVASYDKNTKASTVFTNKWVMLGFKVFLCVAYSVIAVVRDDPKQFIWSAVWFGSAIKGLISDKKQEHTIAASPVIVQAAPMVEQIPAVKVIVDDFPDKPQPFGFKSSWLCIKDTTPEQVIEKLGLKNAVPANWQSGLAPCENRMFVSPVVKGYVIVVGYNVFQGVNGEQELLNLYHSIAQNFKEVQCFANHRVVSFYVWAKFSLGRLIRCYGWCDGIYINKCTLTAEELNLGFDKLVQSNEDDWEDNNIPDEENVIQIAAAWGVDPMFSDGNYEYGVGYLCDI